jgi:hypothetical protein
MSPYLRARLALLELDQARCDLEYYALVDSGIPSEAS